MRALWIVLLMTLLWETGCTPKTKGLKHSTSEKGFLQVLVNGKDITNAPIELKCLEIEYDKKNIVSINLFATTITIIVFSDGEAHKVITYDIMGKKIAECLVVDNRPHTGTVLNLTFGARGLKNSTLITYKNGSVVTVTPYKETEIENLLRQAEKLE